MLRHRSWAKRRATEMHHHVGSLARPTSGGPRLMVVGPQPPPTHGAAVVTRAVLRFLERDGGQPVFVDTSAAGLSGARYFSARIGIHLRCARTILFRGSSISGVYLCGAGGGGLYLQLLIILSSRARDLEVYFHHHSYAYVSQPKAIMSVIVNVLGTRMVNVVLSEGMERDLKRAYPAIRRTFVCTNVSVTGLPRPVHPEVDPNSCSRTRSGTQGSVTLGHVSNLSIEKGLGVIDSSFRSLVEAGLPVRLDLAGPLAGSAEAALVDALRLDFGDRVVWRGAVERSEILPFLSGLDLFLFPSSYPHEAQPLAVIESGLVGTPVICRDVGALGELVAGVGTAARNDGEFNSLLRDFVVGESSFPSRSEIMATYAERFTESKEQLNRLALLMTGNQNHEI